MLPTVFVDLPPAPDTLQEAALDGCRAAMIAGDCRPAVAPVPIGACRATLRWQGVDERTALVSFGRGEPDEEPELKSIDFAESDGAPERWAAAGLVIASLVGDHVCDQPPESTSPTPPPEPRPTSTPPPDRQPQPTRAEARGRVWAGQAWLVARYGGYGERATWGGEAGLALRPHGRAFFGATSVAYGRSGGSPSVSHVTGGLGLGFDTSAWITVPVVDVRVDALAQLFSARDEAARPQSSVSQWRFGTRGHLGVAFPLAGPWSAYLGAELQFLTPRITVEVNGEPERSEPRLSWGSFAGARLSL